ncbi:hypothetical protein KKB40_01420 [Patescibacteria group bacterium]|nr:hypothetical protein [Patescibacteria group bacterium]
MFDFGLVPREVMEFVRYGAIAGFIAVTALIVNLDYKTLSKVFREKTNSFWVVFALSAVIVFLVLLYLFTIVFEKARALLGF